MPANIFTTGDDRIAIHDHNPETGRTECVDLIEGFLFTMDPHDLASFLSEHNYTYEPTPVQ